MPTDFSSIPEGLEVIPSLDGVVIRRVWRSWALIPLFVFACVWDGFLFFWYSQALSQANPPLIMLFFPLLHVSVGLWLSYFVVASFLNKTDITITELGVQVQSGPIPWPGNHDLRAEEISAVLVRKRTGNKGGVWYSVMYVDVMRKEASLVKSLTQEEQAEYIAQSIRETLKLAPPEAKPS